ncbi:MAG TPA: glycosyltransferase family 4 protein [Solirubrobacteraceae bacterium]|nr:glycosyltransferase family 4 protein [Solirubrobacteraceae bacterium]
MYVLHCADYAGPYAGSFVPMLRSAAQEARRRGHETGFVLSDVARGRTWLEELERVGEIQFVHAGGSRTSDTGPLARRLAGVLRGQRGAVVLHTHFSTFDIPAALVGLRRRDSAVLWHEHTPLADEPHTRLRNALRYRWVGRLADRILCVSPELHRDLRARGAPPGKLLDFPNAVDTQRFSPITDSERAAARSALGLPPAARVVLHFGWTWHRKGGDLMLAAAERLGSDPELTVLTVVGESATPDLANHLERIPALRVVAPTSDIRRLYGAADVFLSCSRAEGMPFAVMEALACGLPVVGTALPIQRALLSDLPGACIVPEDDPAAITAAITAVLSLGPGARAAHARLARARIDPAYALETWARRLVDLYESTSG